jgi:uncharacterized protein YndB with AHSA1/START domain
MAHSAAPRELVFRAWTELEHFQKWRGPRGFTVSSCEIDLRPGGGFRFVFHGPDGKDYPFRGEYREVPAPERIVFTGTIDDVPGHIVETRVTFEAQGRKTRLILRQSYTFESDATRGAQIGWAQTLDSLKEYLASM